jgi:hypothetical protein
MAPGQDRRECLYDMEGIDLLAGGSGVLCLQWEASRHLIDLLHEPWLGQVALRLPILRGINYFGSFNCA